MIGEQDGTKRWRNPHHVRNGPAEAVSKDLVRGDLVRRRVAAGWALGTFLIEHPCPETVAALALAGFDFVVLDMEHSSFGYEGLQRLIQAAHASGVAAIVRPWSSAAGEVGKILDIGANGIMAGHVETAQEAEAVVAAARYAPNGKRGFSPLAKYDAFAEPLHDLSHAAYVIVQIEGRDAIDNLPEIASVEGIDALFVGPYDLSLSLGVPPGGEEVYARAEQLARSTADAITMGIYIDDPTLAGRWAAVGYRLQCVSFDGRMFSDAARQVADKARKSAAVGKVRGSE